MKKIKIKGDIVQNADKWIYDWLGMDATSPKDVTAELENANGDDIEVDINSSGGDIFAGSEIYTAIRAYKGQVTINIVGLAASAASVIAMAGYTKISPTALMMIHNVSTRAHGDHQVMDKQSKILQTADQSIANAYKDKTGLSDSQLKKMMDSETWMNAEQALKNHFVDEIMFRDEYVPAMYNATSTINPRAINKLKNLIKKEEETDGKQKDMNILQAQLELLKMKGE